ncbi:hypothetical protein B0O80DRAFT_502296 [Mortierella sp. GBAus27b]|nr:hypothetical protein BGX31_006631 [Mortierella sp. GBA43]KAI8348168.1 hypothetical protein B0O80DRAFT_502296 [Mortierella sp. GBAus27b]
MTSSDPFQLPEILSNVAKFVPKHSRLACMLVSGAWYPVFVRQIWENIVIGLASSHSTETLQSHAHLVRTIHFGYPRTEYAGLRFPNLESIDIAGSLTLEYADLILYHTWITRLRIESATPDAKDGLWDKLHTGFIHLRELELNQVLMDEYDVDPFWKLCTRLESLTLVSMFLPCQGQLLDMDFPRIKKLCLHDVEDLDLSSLTIPIASKCPGLTSFEWNVSSTEVRCFEDFLDQLAAKNWPDLRSLVLPSHVLGEDDLAVILGAMPQVHSIGFRCSVSLQSTSVDLLLQPHFEHLQSIYLRYGNNTDVICPVAQSILSSCPVLERFVSTRVHGKTIADGKPWVCLRLQVLELVVSFDPDTNEHVQPRVFDQLSKLRRLRVLSLWIHHRHDSIAPFQAAVDLRLANSLGKLSTLWSLEQIDWGNSEQRMGEQEVQWILDHWVSLTQVEGRFTRTDYKMDDMLKNRLQEHGIKCLGSDSLAHNSNVYGRGC